MPNEFVQSRLEGVQAALMAVHRSGTSMSSASKGTERQTFINDFLQNVLPATFRFGSGDATDVAGHRSGQLDVVVEYPFSPTLPSVGTASTRLYLAESIAAIVEVKSDVASQWGQALQTAAQLAPLRRSFQATFTFGGRPPSARIPMFVAGYTGWNSIGTVREKLAAVPDIAGVLVIEHGIFISSAEFGGIEVTGPWSLWGLIACLHYITNSLRAAATDPRDYFSPPTAMKT